MVNEVFTAFVLESLEHKMEGIHTSRMFRHHGLYQQGHFFGIIADGRLYFRTDRYSRQKYMQYGMRPYHADDRVAGRFYEVPLEIIGDSLQILEWAKEAGAVPDSVPEAGSEYR